MLVLSRRQHQRLILERDGERIEVVVNAVGKNSVKLGIEASREWRVLREELAAGWIDVHDAQPTDGHI